MKNPKDEHFRPANLKEDQVLGKSRDRNSSNIAEFAMLKVAD